MGHGSYTASDWAKLKTSRKIDTGKINELFKSSGINPKFDPRYIGKRESRDSEDHPNSTPIMIGVDVTGSMGYLSTQIIKESLNELMQKLYSSDLIDDPQLLFGAIGDVQDNAPLQVTQFESDIRIAEQLMDLWIENRGGDIEEDYELMWYFASEHTDIDSFNKRKKKGFCFTIGDAPCHHELTNANIKKIFNDSVDKTYTSFELANMASEKYEVFHILIDGKASTFHDILPGRVLCVSKSDIKYLPEIIMSVIMIARGVSKDEAIANWGMLARGVVKKALKLLNIATSSEINF